MRERRHHPRPYYRQSAERDHTLAGFFTLALTFTVGAMCGASIALGYLQ